MEEQEELDLEPFYQLARFEEVLAKQAVRC